MAFTTTSEYLETTPWRCGCLVKDKSSGEDFRPYQHPLCRKCLVCGARRSVEWRVRSETAWAKKDAA